MEKTPAISIIIPSYKVERWLESAVDALTHQTLGDFEILLVDDGSPDKTGDICDALAERDPRIRVIHQSNQGAAAARNNAMAIARGAYWYFMDADDSCEPTMLEELYNFAEENHLQVAVTGFTIDTFYSKKKFYRELRNAPDIVYASREEFRANAWKLFDAQLLYAPWNKLYRSDYLRENNIVFPATFWDDLPFNLEVFRNVERVGCINRHFYHFQRARAESENTKYRADMYDKREEENRWLHELFASWGIDTPEVHEFLARRYTERLIGCIENITNKNCTLEPAEQRAEIQHIISTPQAVEALSETKPHSAMMSIMLAPLRRQNVGWTLLQSRFISWVKRHSTFIFARLKAHR